MSKRTFPALVFNGETSAWQWFPSVFDDETSYLGGAIRGTIHDTTDDFMFSIEAREYEDPNDNSVTFEMTDQQAEAFAKWILDTLEYRRGKVGQAEQEMHRRVSEEHAGHPIDWTKPSG